MKQIITAIAMLVVLFGCASGVQKLRKLDPGMSPTQVDQIMGRRDSFKTSTKDGAMFTLYQYTNHLCNGHVSIYEKCDFYVIFKNQKLIETGVKDVRSSRPNMHYLYVFD